MGGSGEYYKPEMAMTGIQFAYAGTILLSRAAFLEGMNPRVFVVYRQAVATLAIAPVAYFSRERSTGSCLGLRSFSLLFLASLIGVTIFQNLYFEGIYLVSSSMASAIVNLVPALTFLFATMIGLEKIDTRSLRGVAKIAGTVFCVGGAISMALLKGPKVLNSTGHLASKSGFGSEGENWLLGCLCLFSSTCCCSLWLILQVLISACYPYSLSSSAWMCFFSTLQSAVLTFYLEDDPKTWSLHSKLEIACCLHSGILGSALAFFLQAWCISRRGPIFSAVFSPLSTVIVTILASLFLHEEIYAGSIAGAVGVIMGLYIVLWGKAKDYKFQTETNTECAGNAQALNEESTEITTCTIDLKEPFWLPSQADFDEEDPPFAAGKCPSL